MALGHDRLACQCARDDCSAGDPPKSNVVIHVVADAATVYGDAPIPGYVSGYGALPPEMVRDLVRTAKLTAVPHPGEPAAREGEGEPAPLGLGEEDAEDPDEPMHPEDWSGALNQIEPDEIGVEDDWVE